MLIYFAKSTNIECVYKFDTEGHIKDEIKNFIFLEIKEQKENLYFPILKYEPGNHRRNYSTSYQKEVYP